MPAAAGLRRGTAAHGRAVAAGLLTFAAFSCYDATIKWLSSRYPLLQIIFLSTLFGLLLILATVPARGGLAGLKPRRPGLVAARALLLALDYLLALYAVTRIPLTDAYALIFTAPLLATGLAALLLGDRVGWRSWLALAGGFIGVLIVLRPGFAEVQLGHLAALGAAFTFSLSLVVLRHAGEGESDSALLVSLFVALLCITAPGLFLDPVSPGLTDWALLALAGLLTATAQLALIRAFQSAPTAVVAPMQYTQMLWGIFFGLVLFGQPPELATLLGAGCIIAGALYALRHEARA